MKKAIQYSILFLSIILISNFLGALLYKKELIEWGSMTFVLNTVLLIAYFTFIRHSNIVFAIISIYVLSYIHYTLGFKIASLTYPNQKWSIEQTPIIYWLGIAFFQALKSFIIVELAFFAIAYLNSFYKWLKNKFNRQ